MKNKAPPSDTFPRPPAAYDVKWADSLTKAVTAAFGARPPATQPAPELLVLSPNGSVYAIKVSDDGAISTELRARP